MAVMSTPLASATVPSRVVDRMIGSSLLLFLAGSSRHDAVAGRRVQRSGQDMNDALPVG
jgi:hypothetical protein